MRRKIIGVTVGTPLSPQAIREKLKPITSVNGKEAGENGEVALKISDIEGGEQLQKSVDDLPVTVEKYVEEYISAALEGDY